MQEEEELSIDFETFSEVDLTKVGAYNYARHESTGVFCCSWAFGDEEPALWLPWEPLPVRVRGHIERGGLIRGWNCLGFERLIINFCLAPRGLWPTVTTEQMVDTMFEAGAQALPFSLGDCAAALNTPFQKDQLGHKVMLRVCKPAPTGRMWRDVRDPTYDRTKHIGGRRRFDILYSYCLDDLRAERGVKGKLRRLPERERAILAATTEMNDVGVRIDMTLVLQASKIVQAATKKLNAEIKLLTNGQVKKASEIQSLRAWLEFGGVHLPDSLSKDDIAEVLLRDNLKPHHRRALEIRLEASKTSTAKLNVMQHLVGEGGRVRGMTRYHGATSGRDSATGGLQLQNLARPDPTLDVPTVIDDILAYDAKDPNALEFFEAMHGSAMNAVSSCLRGCLIPDPEDEFVAGDLSQIEARLTGYLAGEEKVIEAFRLYDRKLGPDIYSVTAAGVYSIPIAQVKKDVHRPAGKIGVLACGFGGSANALLKMAKSSHLDLAPLYRSLLAAADPVSVEKAIKSYDDYGRALGAGHDAFMAGALIVNAWRAAHPNIVEWWYALEAAAIKAVVQPGTWFKVGLISFIKQGRSLRMRLPNGKYLFYPYANVRIEPTEYGGERQRLYARAKNLANQWVEYRLNYSVLSNNAVQGTAREVIMDHMLALRAEGIRARLRVHDELVFQAPKGTLALDRVLKRLRTTPDYLPGLPLNADGWVGDRYTK